MNSFLFGVILTAVVVGLFHNLQTISDMAPDAIKNSDTPGLLGAPIAILAIVWFAVIPIWFTKSVLRQAIQGRAARPAMFPAGGMLILAAYFLVFHTDKVKEFFG